MSTKTKLSLLTVSIISLLALPVHAEAESAEIKKLFDPGEPLKMPEFPREENSSTRMLNASFNVQVRPLIFTATGLLDRNELTYAGHLEATLLVMRKLRDKDAFTDPVEITPETKTEDLKGEHLYYQCITLGKAYETHLTQPRHIVAYDREMGIRERAEIEVARAQTAIRYLDMHEGLDRVRQECLWDFPRESVGFIKKSLEDSLAEFQSIDNGGSDLLADIIKTAFNGGVFRGKYQGHNFVVPQATKIKADGQGTARMEGEFYRVFRRLDGGDTVKYACDIKPWEETKVELNFLENKFRNVFVGTGYREAARQLVQAICEEAKVDLMNKVRH